MALHPPAVPVSARHVGRAALRPSRAAQPRTAAAAGTASAEAEGNPAVLSGFEQPLSREQAYAVLGVSHNASAEVSRTRPPPASHAKLTLVPLSLSDLPQACKRAYRRLSLRHHPDVSRLAAADGARAFQLVHAAYGVLKSGGPDEQRPWWRERWQAQLEQLGSRHAAHAPRQRHYEHLVDQRTAAAVRRRAAAAGEHRFDDGDEAPCGDTSAAEQAARLRVAHQLVGLKQRALRKRRAAPEQEAARPG